MVSFANNLDSLFCSRYMYMYCNTKSCTLFQPLGDTQYTYLKLLYSMTIYLLICVKGCLSMENNIGHMDFYPAGNFWFLSLCFTSTHKSFETGVFVLFSSTQIMFVFRTWIFFFVNVCRRCFHVVVGYKMSLLPMISVWYLISRRTLAFCLSSILPDTGNDFRYLARYRIWLKNVPCSQKARYPAEYATVSFKFWPECSLCKTLICGCLNEDLNNVRECVSNKHVFIPCVHCTLYSVLYMLGLPYMPVCQVKFRLCLPRRKIRHFSDKSITENISFSHIY